MSDHHSKRIDDIEVLRAVAIGMTMVGHSGELLFWGSAPSRTASLWGGVDLFFCISGFVIGRTLIGQMQPGQGFTGFVRSAIPFWIRRIFRIWPAAYIWLAIALLLSIVLNKSAAFGPLEANLRDALSAVLQVANLHYLDCITWKSGTCNNLVGIYWSLSLEEQFYIVLPFVLYVVPIGRLRWLLVAGIAIQFFLHRPLWSLMWAVRTDTLMLGLLLAIVQRQRAVGLIEPTFLGRPMLAWLAFAACIGLNIGAAYQRSAVTGFAADEPFVWFNTGIVALICGLTVFIASFDRSYTLPIGAVKRVFVYVGSRSYALYLCHNPLYFLTREIFFRAYPHATFNNRFAPAFITVALILSFGAAELTFRYIETPLRRIGRRKAAEYTSFANAAPVEPARG